jgi:hypothetical protein
MWDQHAFRKRPKKVASAPPDTTGPVIAGVIETPSSASATISWNLDEPGDGVIEYGITDDYGITGAFESSLLTFHSQQLTGLAAGTTYYYQITSRDALQNTTTYADSFTTTGTPPPPPDPGSGATIYGTGYIAMEKGNVHCREYNSGTGAGNPLATRFKARVSGTPRYLRFIWKSIPGYGLGTGGTYRMGVQTLNAQRFPSGTWIAYADNLALGANSESTAKLITFTVNSADVVAGVEYAVVMQNLGPITATGTQANYGSWNYPHMGGVSTYQPQWADGSVVTLCKNTSGWLVDYVHPPSFDLELDTGEHEGAAGIQGRDSVHGHEVGNISSTSICRWRFTYPAAFTTIAVDAVNAFFKHVSGTANVDVTVRVNGIDQATGTFTLSGAMAPGSKGWQRAVLSANVTIDPSDVVDVIYDSSSTYEMNCMLYQTGTNALRSFPYDENGGTMVHLLYEGAAGTTLVNAAWSGHYTFGNYLEIA